jgi:hypothetical protein
MIITILISEQAKKEAREEFVEKVRLFGYWKNNPENAMIYIKDIDKLCKEYEA